jgi:hypothetical protein
MNILEAGEKVEEMIKDQDPSREYVVHPVRYILDLPKWLTRGQIDAIKDSSQCAHAALDAADRVTEWYSDNGWGFGSSDWTYEMASFLRDLGFKVDLIQNQYQVVEQQDS